MDHGVTVTVNLELDPAEADRICSALATMIGDTASFHGFRSIKLVRRDSRLLMIEAWDSEQAFNAYIQWRTDRGDMTIFGQGVISAETAIWPQCVATSENR